MNEDFVCKCCGSKVIVLNSDYDWFYCPKCACFLDREDVEQEMTNYVCGACGKKLDGYCYPEFEDDLCAVCPFNGWNGEEIE